MLLSESGMGLEVSGKFLDRASITVLQEKVPSGPRKHAAHSHLLSIPLALYRTVLNAHNKYFCASRAQVKYRSEGRDANENIRGTALSLLLSY